MAVCVITHKVNDWTTWKAAYDAFNENQVAYGISDKYVLQAANDPSNVTVIVEGELDKIQAFLNAEDLKKAMAEAGVLGSPNIYVGENRL